MSARTWAVVERLETLRALNRAMADRRPPHCKPGCVLDCPYCGMHVVDIYTHLKYRPCPQARNAAPHDGGR